MKTREEIITSMCYTFRPDYGITRPDNQNNWFGASGMNDAERRALWDQMAQIFDNDIAPYVELKRDQRINNVENILNELRRRLS